MIYSVIICVSVGWCIKEKLNALQKHLTNLTYNDQYDRVYSVKYYPVTVSYNIGNCRLELENVKKILYRNIKDYQG